MYRKINIILFFLVFAGLHFSYSQKKGKHSKDEFTYKNVTVENTDSGVLNLDGGKGVTSNNKTKFSARTSSQSGIGETKGNLSVSLSGGAIYDIPIVVPKGINGVTPEISLSYNSQGGSGLAGYGWNIKGISVITRVQSTKYHDNLIDGVNFNGSDRFILDGKRLMLKSGSYGGNGAQYETESFSNLKITSHGVSPFGASYGPEYFKIDYPDGSIAYYGNNSNSRTEVNYGITYWQNTQGVRISYEYTKGVYNSFAIKKISYGSRLTISPKSEIVFNYSRGASGSRHSQAYINDISFGINFTLTKVEVYNNQEKYRKYNLTHNITNLGYSRLTSIQEKSGDDTKSHTPINFNYSNTNSSVNYTGKTANLSVVNIEQRNAETRSLDITGDGKMDFLVYPKNIKDKFWLFKDVSSGNSNFASEISTNGKFEEIFPVTWLNHSNKVLPGQGIAVVQNTQDNKVKFKVYSNGTVNPIYYQYEKTWNAPTYLHTINNCSVNGGVKNITVNVSNGQASNVNGNIINATNTIFSNGNAIYTADQISLKPGFHAKNGSTFKAIGTSNATKTIPNSYISGDFNGDGLTDIIAVSEKYSQSVCNNVYINSRVGYDCRCTGVPVNAGNSKVYFMDLNRNSTSDAIQIGALTKAIEKDSDRLLTADANGDGKTDILHVTDGEIFVYTLNSNNILGLLWKSTDATFKVDSPFLLGDYNGDGKVDFLLPRAKDSNSFNMHISTGTKFVKGIVSQPFTYKETDWNGSNGVLSGYNLLPVDINGDGRTDIVEYNTTTYNNSTNGTQQIKIYNNMGKASTDNVLENPDPIRTKFQYGGTTSKTGNLKHFPIPIFLSSNQPNKSLEFASISDKWVTSFSFTQDHREDVLLRSINNNGVTHSINYNNLDTSEYTSDNLRVYQSNYDESYPNIDLHVAPGTKLVTSFQRVYSGNTIKQAFSYYGAVYNMEGQGFLGFKGIAQSNWHTDGGDRIFNVSKFNTSLRGALTEEHSQPYSFWFTNTPSDIISKTTYSNSSSISSNKVFKLSVNADVTQNNLEGTTITNSYIYDVYNNPTKVTTNYSGGDSSIMDYTYSNSLSSSEYFIGRPHTEKRTTIIGGNSFTTEKQYSYSGNLPTEIKTKGNGTQFDSETFTYDTFGNIIKKRITPYNSSFREVSFEYDSSGRYMTKSKDIEGLSTTYLYNTNNGTLTRETNPFGQTTNYLYDSWNRILTITDYLGKKLTTNYSESNYSYTVTETGDSGLGKITIYDPLKRITKVQEKNALGNWISKSYEYDSLDRLIRESEPYSGGSATQWNTTSYDFYSRVILHNNYAGKSVNIQYNGLSVTVDDGTKTVTTTKNAMGQVLSVLDTGGTINYTYFGNGSVKSSNYNGNIVVIEQDGWGRKTNMTDPSFGEFTYSYNGYGELLSETTPKGSTTYTYDNFGKLTGENTQGEETNMNATYTYNSSTKLLTTIQGLNVRTNENFTYTYLYDSYHRPYITREQNGKAFFEHQVTRDSFGRIENETYITTNHSDNLNSTVKIKNVYNSNSGDLIEILDYNTNTSLWKLNSLNARNKATQTLIGNGIIKNKTYDSNGFLTNISDKKGSGSSLITAMDIDYTFDHQRGNLLSRNNKVFSWSEAFNYDSLDRLLGVSGSANYSHSYDDRGRITNNSNVGDYTYTSSSSYKLKEVQLNTKGDLHYQNNPLQKIKYNAFKKPVSIHSNGNGRVDFEYSILKNRSHAYYGGEQENKLDRRFQKHYSSVSPVEIEIDSEGSTKIITFIGGNEYSAPIMYVKKTGSNPVDGFHYLHRDYLGSILAITDSNATIIEQRQFGAWGTIDKFKTGNSEVDFTNETTLLNRGYTGHEHFFEVALIHMNGRMYDAKLGRFLSPDNYIQQPYNSQNYNRYSYVLNNPLKYTDYSGELIGELGAALFFVVKALFVVSAGVGAYAIISNLSAQSGGGSSGQPSISNNNSQGIASGSPPSNPGVETKPDLPWYVKLNMFNTGFKYGFAAGGASTWDLVKGLVTLDKETWKGLGQGMLDMAEMSNGLSIRGHMLRTQTAMAVDEFVGKIPEMNSYEIGHHLGYGTEKIAEAIALTKGTGLAVKGFQSIKAASRLPANLVNVPKISTPSGKFYTNAYEMTLSPKSYPGVSRYMHFKEANVALNSAMKSNPLLSELGISIPRSPTTGSIIGKPPTGWVWHHNTSKGLMQLVPKAQHPNIPGGIFWETMHPGGIGGFSIWGK